MNDVDIETYQDGSVYVINPDSPEAVRLARNDSELGILLVTLLEHILKNRPPGNDAVKQLAANGFEL